MAKQDDYVKTALRLPPALHASLTESAAARGHSLNSEMVSRLEGSFEIATGAGMARSVIRLGVELADVEQQLASANLRLAELAYCLRLAVYSIPKEVLESDKALREEVSSWLKDTQELIEAPDALLREVEEKTQKFEEAAARLGELAKDLTERRKALETALAEGDDLELPPRKRSRHDKD